MDYGDVPCAGVVTLVGKVHGNTLFSDIIARFFLGPLILGGRGGSCSSRSFQAYQYYSNLIYVTCIVTFT